MAKFCCFWDPAKDFSEKQETDTCPICQRPYNFPLVNMPTSIFDGNIEYTVIKSIGRGFYGVTFLCEKQEKRLSKKYILKIIPKKVYDFFGKNFDAECNTHARVSEFADYLIKLEHDFESRVSFNENALDCYIAVLEYVKGEGLDDFLHREENLTPSNLAQISIDLLLIWNELTNQKLYHNDLHFGNLMVEQLDIKTQRIKAISDNIKLRAIDLNSAAEANKSDYAQNRDSDKITISNHIKELANRFKRKNPNIDSISDVDMRLIEGLETVSYLISGHTSLEDGPTIRELIKIIEEKLNDDNLFSPWKKPLVLTKIDEGINSQSILTAHIPKLLVDPDDNWMKEVTIGDPQLITGMRGCGKTMLLNALDIHARIIGKDNCSEESKNRIKTDNFIGLKIPTSRILNHYPKMMMEFLVLRYAIASISATRHLKENFGEDIKKDYHIDLKDFLENTFNYSFRNEFCRSDIVFEKSLKNNFEKILNQGVLQQKPTQTVFEELSQTIKGYSPILSSKKVFYLLDDASTRFLDIEILKQIFSSLLFYSNECAFKITTEQQTIDFGLLLTNKIEKAQELRDYKLFDLGAEVYKKTKDVRTGKEFIKNILKTRQKYLNNKNNIDPEDLLGDCDLISIARKIVTTKATSNERKEIYHGMSALSSLCVGDIGDIVHLYEQISKNHSETPVSKKEQHNCFLNLSSTRLFQLNDKMKDFAKSFSEASYTLLMQSNENDGTRKRLRQYNDIYIRVTDGDRESQFNILRELIDSGVFVFAEGTQRTKTHDTDPQHQFKLAYRKVFGLNNIIGLAHSDRYELSGKKLESWLQTADKDFLLTTKGIMEDVEAFDTQRADNISTKEEIAEQLKDKNRQISFFDLLQQQEDAEKENIAKIENYLSDRIVFEKNDCCDVQTETLITAYGFEERVLESTKKLIKKFKFKNAIVIKYKEAGFGNINKIIAENIENIIEIDFDKFEEIEQALKLKNNYIIDISGLYKPLIFKLIRLSLIEQKEFSIGYTEAKQYYPLNEDIIKKKKELKGDKEEFYKLSKNLLTGEKHYKEPIPLIEQIGFCKDRMDMLIGFVSPKNQRLFVLLNKNEYSHMELIVPSGNTARDIFTRDAASIAITNYQVGTSNLIEMKNINDLHENIEILSKLYFDFYVNKGMNVEISLTGSKLQTVACAAFSTVSKINQCWYVMPQDFEVENFTKGFGETEIYKIISKKLC